MKTIKFYILNIGLIISLLASTACENYINLKPIDVITDDQALITLDDFQQALNATYGALTSGNYYGGNFTLYADIMTDNGRISSQSLGTGRVEHAWLYTAGNSTIFLGYWGTIYSMIYRANVIIEKIANLQADESIKKQILGEALMLRAIGHFDLVRAFAPRYKFTADASHPGIPLITVVPDANSEPARNTVKQVYDQIKTDLEAARQNMTATSANATQLTPLAATAMLARVALYEENFAQAIQYATEVINARTLATGANFTNMWTSDAVGEVIFKVKMTTNENAIGGILYDNALDLAFFNPTQDVMVLYDETNDIRFGAYYQKRTNKESLVKKYFGRPERYGLNDIKLLRVAEMYLIRAEANIRTNQIAAAETDYNTLRNARINGNTPITPGSLTLEQLLLERRRELAWEGHRWFDLGRLNQGIARADCNDVSCSLEAGNFRFILPIPQREIFANDNMVQNTGY
jgi:hypothetical protein